LDQEKSLTKAMPSQRASLEAAYRGLRAGRFADVEALCMPLIRDGVPEGQLLAGIALAALGDATRAAALLAAVARQRPEHRHPCLDLAELLRDHGKTPEVEAYYRAALRLTPDDTRLSLAYAASLTDDRRPDEAEAILGALVRDHPDLAAAQIQLGILYDNQARVREASVAFQAAIRAEPDSAAGWANLGRLLANEGLRDPGLRMMTQAIRLKPNDPQLHLNRAFALLKAGRFREGWLEHEWRFRTPGHTKLPRSRLLPDLHTIPDLAGRTILVTHEEGFGDTLQFLRYVPMLADLGARVLISVPPPLAAIARRVRGAEVVASETVSFDWHCPFLSLPRAFGTEVETIPASPYLSADPDLVAHWRQQVGTPTERRVGLVWAGEPRPGARWVDGRRSAPLAALLPLAEVPGIKLVSLQVGAAAAQRDALGAIQIENHMTGVRDFHDTAAIIKTLDLVVTVDTAVAHLAAGLGRPVFLLDRYDNCWRWLHGRTDSPWYPSLRIFRQTKVHDWAGPVHDIAAALAAL
jgi:tetratricopeptide (TPR) repeat protein